VPLDSLEADIFTAAQQCFGFRESCEFGAQPKCIFHRTGKSLVTRARRKQTPGFRPVVDGGETSDSALKQRKLDATDACRFARAIDLRLRRKLILVDRYESFVATALQHLRQLQVRHQMIPASQIIAGNFARGTALGDAYGLDTILSQRRDHPGAE
jgi:hypothetical protein